MLRSELFGLGFSIVVVGVAGACATGSSTPSGDGGSGQGGDSQNTVVTGTGQTTGQGTGQTTGQGTGQTTGQGTGNTATTGTGAGCGSDFMCNDQSCIQADWECDGIADCADSSDELPTNSSCPAVSCDPLFELDCGDGTCALCFGCVCDGFSDCGNGADEDVATCPQPPTGWNCSPSYYGDGDCDCGCGAFDDVDCGNDATVGACLYCDDIGSCSPDACPGTINPTDNSVCI